MVCPRLRCESRLTLTLSALSNSSLCSLAAFSQVVSFALRMTDLPLVVRAVIMQVAGMVGYCNKEVRREARGVVEAVDAVSKETLSEGGSGPKAEDLRKLATLAWQLELCMWLGRGGNLTLSPATVKEAIIGVRVGMFMAAWRKKVRCSYLPTASHVFCLEALTYEAASSKLVFLTHCFAPCVLVLLSMLVAVGDHRTASVPPAGLAATGLGPWGEVVAEIVFCADIHHERGCQGRRRGREG